MKTILHSLVLAIVLSAASTRCHASMDIENVSKERAAELGVVVRATGNGPNEVWVQLEFKPEGKLGDFSHVSLEIADGDKFLLGYTALAGKRSETGTLTFGLLVNRAFLNKITLRIVTGHPMDQTGHDLRIKDFVDPDKVK